MIIREIIIDGFGVFGSFEIKNLRSGINIISGRNEAGKSTLQKFIRFTLFGYPRLKEQRMMPLRGGNHGGRMKLLMSSGEEVLLDRAGTDNLTFYKAGVSSGDRNQWSAMIGNANDLIFGNIYAFSTDELVGLGSFTASGLEDRLFSLGSGLGNISIGGITASIQETIDSAYSTRGKNQKIPVILKKIEEKKKELEPLENNISRFRELREKLVILGNQAVALEAESIAALAEKNSLENYLKCYDSYIELSAIDSDLAGLPPMQDYPDNGPQLLSELENREKHLEKKIRDLLEGTDDEKGIVDIENEIEVLTFSNDLLARKDDADYLRDNLELFIRMIADKRDLTIKLGNLDKEIRESLKRINTGWTEQHIADLDELVVHQDIIRSFRTRFEDNARKKLEAETLLRVLAPGRRIVNVRNLLKVVSALFFLFSVPFFIYDLAAAGIFLAAAALVLIISTRFILVKDPGDSEKKKLDDLENDEKELSAACEKYISESLHLNGKLTPEAVLDILLTVSDLKKDIAERDSVKDGLSDREAFIGSYESTAMKFSDVVSFRSPETVSRVRQVLDDYTRDKEVSLKKEGLEKNVENKKRSLVRAGEELKIIQGEIQAQLDSIAAISRDDYRLKYAVNNKVAGLTAARKKEMHTISTIAGLEKVTGVLEFLRTNTRDSVRMEHENIEQELKKKSDTLGAIREETGRIRQEIKQIENNSDIAGILTGIETEKKKLEIEYQGWLANKIALRVLNDVRSRFEKEKQPEVIKSSGMHFKKITGGNFVRITSSLDNREITVFDINEKGRRIDQLSRGTREQLLLSLRLGIIGEYERHSEPLPLVVDEIFVNFDPERTRKTAEIFSDFARDRQIIIFSCHPDTASYFKKSEVNLVTLD